MNNSFYVNVDRFKKMSYYKNNITFDFCDEHTTTLKDIDHAIKNKTKGIDIPFGDTEQYVPKGMRDINYHIMRVIYFVEHSDEIKNIKIKSSWWIENNILFSYPHLFIEDGYHRIAAAFYLDLKTVQMTNYDFIRRDLYEYITENTDIYPKNEIIKIPLWEVNSTIS